MCRHDTRQYNTALTGALKIKIKATNYKQHNSAKLSLASLCLKQATVGEVAI